MTCVPKEGIYMFSEEKLNYTQALNKCYAHGGTLINVITEEGTAKASNVIARSKTGNAKKLQAYVGLSDMQQEGKFLSVIGEYFDFYSFGLNFLIRFWTSRPQESRWIVWRFVPGHQANQKTGMQTKTAWP